LRGRDALLTLRRARIPLQITFIAAAALCWWSFAEEKEGEEELPVEEFTAPILSEPDAGTEKPEPDASKAATDFAESLDGYSATNEAGEGSVEDGKLKVQNAKGSLTFEVTEIAWGETKETTSKAVPLAAKWWVLPG
jgi:hypothetical protein